MKILYARVSSMDQKTDRQRVTEKEFDAVVEDKCSGAIPFFERNGGMEIKALLDKDLLKQLYVWQIDRLGRDLRDIINTIHYFNEKNVPIHFVSQGLTTLNPLGQENPISKMMISILGIVGEMERNQIRERQREGIRIAKLKGAYRGRKKGTTEDIPTFLSKPRNQKAIEYLRKNYTKTEVSRMTGLHINTLSKIKSCLQAVDGNRSR